MGGRKAAQICGVKDGRAAASLGAARVPRGRSCGIITAPPPGISSPFPLIFLFLFSFFFSSKSDLLKYCMCLEVFYLTDFRKKGL